MTKPIKNNTQYEAALLRIYALMQKRFKGKLTVTVSQKLLAKTLYTPSHPHPSPQGH